MEFDEMDFGYDPYDGDDLMAFRERELDEDAAAGEFDPDPEHSDDPENLTWGEALGIDEGPAFFLGGVDCE